MSSLPLALILIDSSSSWIDVTGNDDILSVFLFCLSDKKLNLGTGLWTKSEWGRSFSFEKEYKFTETIMKKNTC